MSKERIRVFIGAGEASRIEKKTLVYTLKKNSKSDLDIYAFNGTHNSIEREGHEPVLCPMSLPVKYSNTTEFSHYRFYIPQICGFKGKAIWIDSDTLALDDIKNLWDLNLNGSAFMALKNSYDYIPKPNWGLSVMLIDCEKARFDMELYHKEITQGLYTVSDLHQMLPKFLSHHPFEISELPPEWNHFDKVETNTRLVHFTNLLTQPWKFSGHPFEEFWYRHLNEAVEAGYVGENDFYLNLVRAYIRQDIKEVAQFYKNGGKHQAPSKATLPIRALRKFKRLLTQ